MPNPSPHILFVTGGSGGHIYPLLSVVDAMKAIRPDVHCSYIGTEADVRSPGIKQRTDLSTHTIHAGKLHRFLTLKQFSEFVAMGRGFSEAATLVKSLKPDAVFAKGGAVSVPVVLAAARLGIPIFSHETDVRSGLANRFAARFAKTVFTAYPIGEYIDLPETRLQYVGQPVRAEFFKEATGDLTIDGRIVSQSLPLVTVTGGSQGAKGLNRMVARFWPEYLKQVQVLHICGVLDHQPLQEIASKLPSSLQANLFLTPYLAEGMPLAFQRSQLVIERAGGTTFELAASRTATILVPLPSAAQDHQRANAEVFLSAGAAKVVQEAEGGEVLKHVVSSLLEDPAARHQLGEALSHFAKPSAASDIAQAILEYLDA